MSVETMSLRCIAAEDEARRLRARVSRLRSALDYIEYLRPVDGNPHGSLWEAQKRARESLDRDDATQSNGNAGEGA